MTVHPIFVVVFFTTVLAALVMGLCIGWSLSRRNILIAPKAPERPRPSVVILCVMPQWEAIRKEPKAAPAKQPQVVEDEKAKLAREAAALQDAAEAISARLDDFDLFGDHRAKTTR